MNRTRLGRAALLAASLTMALTACGEATGGSDTAGSKSSEPDSAATQSGSGTAQTLGDHDGLCGWATPEQLESIFGQPVDAVGTVECRVVAEGDLATAGIYHVALNQQVGFDELDSQRRSSLGVDGRKVCGQESSRWQGMRIDRAVICPKGGGGGYGPSVKLELAPGRVLVSLPHESDSMEDAEADSRQFVEILKAFAEGGSGRPLINEVMPGEWLEIYNPGDAPVDLSGYTAEVYDDLDEGIKPRAITVPAGTSVAPGARVVVDLSKLKGFRSDWPRLELSDADGRFVDVTDIEADRGEVVRRNGDGGTFCSFGSTAVTKGEPNPPRADDCA